MGNTFSESIEMTAELEQIFNSIYSNSMHSSAELFQKYMNDRSEYKNDFLKYQMQVSTFQQQISSLRSQYSNMSDIDFFKEYVSQYSRSVIDKMKEEYEDQLSQEQLQRLNNFNLEVVNNPDFKHDMTAFPEQSRVSINMPYLRGNDVVEKIIFAIGIIPHELHHYVIRMLKPEGLVDQRMLYNLKNGEVASNSGMVGHILNEGFVEKLSIDFCKKNNIFYSSSPAYVSFVDFCNYIVNNDRSITIDYLMSHDYSDVLGRMTPEVRERYYYVERMEYAKNFSLKLQDGTYREIERNEILSSKNEKVILDKKNSFDKRTKQEEEIYSQIKQKNQTIALQKQETMQKEKPKVLTKTKESISSSSTVGFVSILTLTLIIGIMVIIAGLCLNI